MSVLYLLGTRQNGIVDYKLLLSKKERYLARIGEILSTQSGILKVKKKKKVKSHLGKEFKAVEPTLLDFLESKRIKRIPQVVLPKDASLILAFTGINPASKIVDAGTGSGFLAMFLGYYLSKGKVVTYEINKEYAKLARKNLKVLGLKNVKVKVKDIRKGIDEKEVDLITLDLKDAEKVIKHAWHALKSGGWLVVFSPMIEQVIEVRKELDKFSFTQIKTIECLVREWQVEAYTRPKTTGLLHTLFLTFARKI